MAGKFTRIGAEHFNNLVRVRRGGITVDQGNVSGSSISTGSFGKLTGDGSALTGISTAAPIFSQTGSYYSAPSDIQITGSLSVFGNISGSFGGLSAGQRYQHNQTSAATTWTVSHNFDLQYVNVDVYADNNQIVIPTSITATDGNTLTIVFNNATAGKAIVSTGGQDIGSVGKIVVHNQSTAATNWRVSHSLGEQYPSVTVYDDIGEVIIPETIKATSTQLMDITFNAPMSGNANISIGGGTPTGTVSSSAQLASDISGSFTTASSSLASRITTNESYVKGKEVLSGSAQIATVISGSLGTNASLIRSLTAAIISGSFTSLSSSLASRITAEEAEAEGSVISSSAQIASDISGSFTTASSSLASRITVTEASGALINQDVQTTASPTFVDITATGTVTAQEFHTEFISASVLYGSGSTRFGDTTDDTHAFTGSLTTSGSSLTIASTGTYSGSSTSTGSFGRVEAGSVKGTLVTAGQTNITSVGTIGTGVWDSTFGSTANTLISGSANAANISGSLGANATLIRSLTAGVISGSVTNPSGNVSGSSTSTGSFGRVEAGSVEGTLVTAAQTNVTSVGTIGTGIWNSTFGSTANTIISGSVTNPSGNVSGSSTSTGSFGRVEAGSVEGTLVTAAQTNITSVGTIGTGVWEGTTVAVDQGGTGATSLNNLITLTTHTTGSYVGTITGGTNLSSTAATSGEGTTHTLNVDDAFLVNDANDTTSGTITAAGLITSGNVSGSSTSTGSFGRVEGSLFSGSFIGKGTFNNIDDPTAMAIALG